MRSRHDWIAAGLLAVWLCGGCELLVPFETVPEGSGGAGGTGATGGTSTSGGSSGGGASTTTSTGPASCQVAADCDAQNPCAKADCVNAECAYSPVNEGTTPPGVADPPGDCIRPVCNGGVLVEVVDKEQSPDTDPTDCTSTFCLDEGGTQTDDANEGELCGQQPADPCKKSACQSGACVVQGLPDGTVVDPGDTNIPSGGTDCRDKVCEAGVVVSKQNFMNCQDPTPDNCLVPSCNMSGVCLTGAATMNAPAGFPCKKQNGQNGTCDSFGNCT